MILNPIIANLHNTKTDRFHPIFFKESPLPGPPEKDKPIRHKSVGHHTGGFDNRADAISECHDMVEKIKGDCIGKPQLFIQNDFLWNGEGMPVMVEFFGDRF